MSRRRLAIIPARGGSKRIPRKNLREFAGRPMIGYAITIAHASNLFDHVVVSTDDPEVADVARRLGADVPFMRPAELADDHTGTVPVIAHAVRACADLGWSADAVCCLYPGVPLLGAQTLQAGCDVLEHGDSPYVFPVLAFRSPIQRALRRDADGRSQPFFPEFAQTRTQDLPAAYHDAGQFYWGRTEAWLRGLALHARASTLVLRDDEAVDIDTPEDWSRAEALFLARRAGAASGNPAP